MNSDFVYCISNDTFAKLRMTFIHYHASLAGVLETQMSFKSDDAAICDAQLSEDCAVDLTIPVIPEGEGLLFQLFSKLFAVRSIDLLEGIGALAGVVIMNPRKALALKDVAFACPAWDAICHARADGAFCRRP
mgnify:CR=1 FL=1